MHRVHRVTKVHLFVFKPWSIVHERHDHEHNRRQWRQESSPNRNRRYGALGPWPQNTPYHTFVCVQSSEFIRA